MFALVLWMTNTILGTAILALLVLFGFVINKSFNVDNEDYTVTYNQNGSVGQEVVSADCRQEAQDKFLLNHSDAEIVAIIKK